MSVLFWAVRFSSLTHYCNSHIPRCSSLQIWHLLWCSNQMHSVWQLYVQNLNWLIHLSETGMCPRPLTDVSTGLVDIPTRGKRHVNHSCSKMTYILNIVRVKTVWLPIHIGHTCFKKSLEKTSGEPTVKGTCNSMKFQIFFQLEEGSPFRAIRTAPTIQFMATISFLMKIPVLLKKKECCTTWRGQRSWLDKIKMPWSVRGIPEQKDILLKEMLKRT